MRILRLADKKKGGMEKLYYFVLQADRVLPKYLKIAEQTADAWITEEHKEVLDKTDDLASMEEDDDEYESDSEDEGDEAVVEGEEDQDYEEDCEDEE